MKIVCIFVRHLGKNFFIFEVKIHEPIFIALALLVGLCPGNICWYMVVIHK